MNQDYINTLQKLLPPVSYDRNGAELSIELTAEGKALNTLQKYSIKALNGITPFYADELLEDWERVLGLPTDFTMLYQRRLELVLQKLAEMGGLSIPYFISLAKKLGYTITITEGASEIFRAGVGRAGDSLGIEGLMWVWRVHVHSRYIHAYYFRAGVSRAGDRLISFVDPVLESRIEDLKPAFTFVTFHYEE